MSAPQVAELQEPGRAFTRGGRTFVRATVPAGEHRGLPYALARPLAGRYEPLHFHSALGHALLIQGRDLRTGAPVLVKGVLRYDVEAQARIQDRDGFTSQLRIQRKALEAERRLLVALRNAGCHSVPLPHDFVFDTNPQLQGPYPTEDLDEWEYDDAELLASEPYLVLRPAPGRTLDEVLSEAPERRLPESRALVILDHLARALGQLHRPLTVRPGMTWQIIYQDLRPGNVVVGPHDEAALLRLDGCQLVNRDTGLRLLPGVAVRGYAAPEAGQGQVSLTPAADVYGAGVLLWQLLSGRDPREAGRLEPRAVEGRCRPATWALVERCLAADPSRRPADGEALHQALEPLLRAP